MRRWRGLVPALELRHHLIVDLEPASRIYQDRSRAGTSSRLDSPLNDVHDVGRRSSVVGRFLRPEDIHSSAMPQLPPPITEMR